MVVKIDDNSVRNFVELVSLLGAEVGSTQVKGVLLKKITTKMKGDQHTPDIRDVLMAEEGNIIAVDNKNSCVKVSCHNKFSWESSGLYVLGILLCVFTMRLRWFEVPVVFRACSF